MKMNSMVQRALVVGTIAGLVGCAGAGPLTTTPANQAPGVQPDRQVQSLAEGTDPAFEQTLAALPQRISEADAQRLLIEIDPNQIKNGSYSVLRHGGGRSGSFSSRRGHYGGYGGYGRGFRYYNYGGSLFPYFSYGSYYYPYAYSGIYPYLTGLGGIYNPYTYYNPFFRRINPYMPTLPVAAPTLPVAAPTMPTPSAEPTDDQMS